MTDKLVTNDLYIQPGAARIHGFSFDKWLVASVTVSTIELLEVTDAKGNDKSAELDVTGLAVNGSDWTDPSGQTLPASRGGTGTVDASSAVEAIYFLRIKGTFSVGGSDIFTTKVICSKARS